MTEEITRKVTVCLIFKDFLNVVAFEKIKDQYDENYDSINRYGMLFLGNKHRNYPA